MKHYVHLFLPIVLAAALSHATYCAADAEERIPTYTAVWEVPPEVTSFYDTIISPDGEQWAYRVGIDGRFQAMIINGHIGELYDEIMAQERLFYPGGRTAYMARRGNDWHVVLDGVEGPPYEFIAGGTYARAYGFVYNGYRDHKVTIMIDGEPFDYIGDIPAPGLVFCPSGERAAYITRIDDRVSLIENGNVIATFDFMTPPFFCPKGLRLGSFIRQDGQWHLFMDGELGLGYDGIGGSGAIFSPDGEHVAYTASMGVVSLVLNGKEVATHDAILEFKLLERENDVVPVYSAIDHKVFTVYDNGPCQRDLRYGPNTLTISNDRTSYGYIAFKDGVYALLDNEVHGPYISATKIGTVKGRPELWCVAETEEGLMLISNKHKYGPYENIIVSTVTFCPEARRCAFVAETGDEHNVIANGESLGNYKWADFIRFSQDGKHIAYVVRREEGYYMVLDGAEYGPYSTVVEVMFKESTLRYWAYKEQKKFLVEISIR